MQEMTSLMCDVLQGVGKKYQAVLAENGFKTLQDLVLHLPFRYEDRTCCQSISGLLLDETVLIQGEIIALTHDRFHRNRLTCQLADGTGTITLRFYHMHPYQLKHFSIGRYLRCFGQASQKGRTLEMLHPDYTFIADLNETLPGMLTPIYPIFAGITQRKMQDIIQQALLYLDTHTISSVIPDRFAKEWQLPSLTMALRALHTLQDTQDLSLFLTRAHPAQIRLMLEELISLRLAMLKKRRLHAAQTSLVFQNPSTLFTQIMQSTRIQLTAAQDRVIAEIQTDLAKGVPMQRLLQGDVGCGKTFVALASALMVIENGAQVALMAPTELLAKQHADNFERWLTPFNINVVSLLGQESTGIRSKKHTAIANGQAALIIGTHALFQAPVGFLSLGLVIIDEQHRFGVKQRQALYDKGKKENLVPHLLLISATPIPRTLSQVYYADLDLSVIDEYPKDRKSVTTIALPKQKRQELIDKIDARIAVGEQIFWIATAVEETQDDKRESVQSCYARLKAALPHRRIALAHGKMPSSEKQAVMQTFSEGAFDILVATTVIEVGVDVPSATTIVIEDPDALGLSQLHQLRGRVGRGKLAGFCVLLYQSPLSESARGRIVALRESGDGFHLAQLDLTARGPGDLLGEQQSGLPQFQFVDLVQDAQWLEQAAHYAEAIDCTN